MRKLMKPGLQKIMSEEELRFMPAAMDNSTTSGTDTSLADVPAITVNNFGDSGMLSVYLEVPVFNRRRRSYQPSTSSGGTTQEDVNASLKSDIAITEDLKEEEFQSPRLFTELLILTDTDTSMVTWKETARWVRFEEDVEEGGERWSKPRISILQSHAFLQMRSLILSSHIILDVEKESLNEIVDVVLNNEQVKSTLPSATLNKVRKTLLMKPIHLYELSRIKDDVIHKSANRFSKFSKKNGKKNTNGIAVVTVEDEYKGNMQFLKKIPQGSESAMVMVGEIEHLECCWCSLIRIKNSTNLGSLAEVPVPVKFIFILLGPLGEIGSYYEIGRSIGALFSDEVFREVAYLGKTKEHILAGIDEFLDASFILPPGEWDPTIRLDPPESAPTKEMRNKKDKIEGDEEEEERNQRESSGLVRSGRIFGGLINDIKRKAPWYLSDYEDAISLQSVATFFFLYFACLTPIVTFGGLLGEATNNNIAVMESLVAGLICGVVYGLFAGQPLTLLGSTGPVLVFENIMHDLCGRFEWDYLSFRLWIGLWAAVILLILVAIDASAFVCYITRFTEENFATLIALIFIYKAIEKVLKIGEKYPMKMDNISGIMEGSVSLEHSSFNDTLSFAGCRAINDTSVDCKIYYPNIYLMSIILFFGTFFIATTLKNFRAANFFPAKVRSYLSDFSVIIAIVVMSVLDIYLGINTPKLHIPQQFKPTSASRGWIIFPFNENPWWTAIVAIVPAMLACILLFMDQQITAVIINRKEHKLKKGCGYHLDLFVLAILIAVNSIMGLPWFVAATVLSINHVNSLHLESECTAPGEQPKFLGVRENRVTHILIFLSIGLSVLMTPLLQLIPMPVLFGVFLYMGISALKGIQLFDRILIMFMPLKYQPDHPYLRKVKLQRVHLYTLIQIACIAILWIIKSIKMTSILFPLMLVIMIGIRKLMEFIFSQRELKILDDALPEFKRREKIEDGIDMEEDEWQQQALSKRDRTMSIFVADGGVINIEEDYSPKASSREIEKGTFANSTISSRKNSVASTRRGSVLETIFSTSHNYMPGNLRIPTNTDTFRFRRRSEAMEAISSEELAPLNG